MQLHKRQKLQPQCDATIAALRQRYQTRAAQLQCPLHKRPPVVSVTGDQLELVQIHIEGCCPDFVEQVRQALRAAA